MIFLVVGVHLDQKSGQSSHGCALQHRNASGYVTNEHLVYIYIYITASNNSSTTQFRLKIEFSNILGGRNFFLKKNFVVKISTTKKIFQKKISTPQNIRKADFRDLLEIRDFGRWALDGLENP